MRAVVDHRARRQEVIAKAIRLFARLGYKDVSFRELSEECGLARTVLYRYFRSKRQIFDSAISLALGRIVQKHNEIVHSKLPASVRLRQICNVVTATLFDNRDFLFDGELLKPAKLECETKRVKFLSASCYKRVKDSATYVQEALPCVFHSEWRAKDGREVAVLANWTREERKYTLDFGGVKKSGIIPALSWRIEPIGNLETNKETEQ